MVLDYLRAEQQKVISQRSSCIDPTDVFRYGECIGTTIEVHSTLPGRWNMLVLSLGILPGVTVL